MSQIDPPPTYSLDDIVENSDDIYITSKGMWQGLVIFLMIMFIIVALFYAYSLAILVDPNSIPIPKGPYGVESGLKGKVLNTCPESGFPGNECQFNIETIRDATNKCSSDFNRCSAFYYDGSTMEYVDPSVYTNVTIGGTYIRQFPIDS